MTMHDREIPPTTHMNRREMLRGAAIAIAAVAASPLGALAASRDDITHTNAAIHNRRVFNASPTRVYDALTNEEQFNKVTMLSEAMRGGMPPSAKPTRISTVAGGAFTLFGGVITGRHIELVPYTRLVQAWRDSDWKPGVFSLVKFELSAERAGTVLNFEHTGFPDAAAQHLNAGWSANYWEPLARYLA